MKKSIVIGLFFLTDLATLTVAGEDNAINAAKQVLKDNQSAVVWVSAVVKTHMSGQGAMFHKEEQKVETVGTVIDSSGLIVVSATMLDPMSLFGMFMQEMGEQSADATKYAAKSDISSIKVRMADGKEIPAQLVLTDPDLDLSFLMPEKEKGKELPKFKHVKMDAAARPEVLDELIALSRLGKNLDRQPLVIITRVASIVTKPRSFYVPSEASQASLGTPVFALDKKPVGIMVLRKAAFSGGGLMGMMNMAAWQAIMPVILPAADVMEVADQALQKAHASGETGDKPAPTEKPAGKTD